MKVMWDVVAICQVNLYLGEVEAETREEAIEHFQEASLTADKIVGEFELTSFAAGDRLQEESPGGGTA